MGTQLKALLPVLLLWILCCLSYVEATPTKYQHLIVPGVFRNVFARSQWTAEGRNTPKNLDNIYNDLTIWSEIGSNRSQCQSSVLHFASDLMDGKPYTKKALDSSGKLGSGVLTGNYRWLGRYYECLKIKEDDFQGKWCSIFSGHRSPVTGSGGLMAGICLPNACTEEDLKDFLLFMSNQSSLTIIDWIADCPIQPWRWTSSDVIFVTILSVLIILVITATVTEISINQCSKGITDENLADVGGEEMIIGVTSLNRTEPSDNIVDMYDYMIRNITSLVITNTFMAVDTFFFISGLLVAYTTLQDIERLSGKSIPKLYLQRYLRLTPTYAFVILFVTGFMSKCGNGPTWPNAYHTHSDGCVKYWWTNLLYIGNLYPASFFQKCFSPGWYLDNNMQFFLLAPISLLVLKRNRYWGLSLLLFGIFSSILVTGVISSHYDSQPLPVIPSIGFKTPNITTSTHLNVPPPMNKKDEFWSDTYERPWCRISVYIIGMLVGYILVTTKSTMKLSKIFVISCWGIAAALNLTVVFGTWWYVQNSVPMETNLAAFYDAMHRPAWACGVGWVVFACSTGNGGPVDTFLSWKALVPFSRLTYCLYLSHVTVFYIWLGSLEMDYHYNTMQIPIFYLGILTLSIGTAYALSMLVETPLINLMKLLTERRTPSSLANSELLNTDVTSSSS